MKILKLQFLPRVWVFN